MTKTQQKQAVERLLQKMIRAAEELSPEQLKEKRAALRDHNGLVFVNAKPYFRRYARP